MNQTKLNPVSVDLAGNAQISKEKYQAMYQQSLNNPDAFWAEQAQTFLLWDKPWSKIHTSNFHTGEAAWFIDGKLNVSTNCIDRHLPHRAQQTAFIWEGDNPDDSKNITYQQLHDEVCKLANALKSRGVKKGDRVYIYMPMIPQAAYAIPACTRISAIHSVVFGGFSAEALKDRIVDADCRTIITADEGVRGGKPKPESTCLHPCQVRMP